MPSMLSWIDYDSEAHDRSKRIMALFSERETRDELGLGGIRDSFSDILFPGTSTIQTRLRYMLIVPWIFKYFEEKEISSKDFGKIADELERKLISVLLSSASQEEWGVFGGVSGTSLKRLPSAVYWGGLGSWGIRVFPGSQNRYYLALDLIYARRKQQLKRKQSSESLDYEYSAGVRTWHPRLPSPPEGFPGVLDIHMRREESRFIQDCIKKAHGESLLSHLALHCSECSVEFPWMHPEMAGFSWKQRAVLEHARLFSLVMNGASILYNVLLAELSENAELTDKHRERFYIWEEKVIREMDTVRQWCGDLDKLWSTVLGQGFTISQTTRSFVERWCTFVVDDVGFLLRNSVAGVLVKHREIKKKGSHSKFVNRKALDQWGGASGIDRLSYRWSNVQALLSDLYKGLES